MAEPPFAESKVSRKMQITIPRKVVKALGGVRPGEYVLFSTTVDQTVASVFCVGFLLGLDVRTGCVCVTGGP